MMVQKKEWHYFDEQKGEWAGPFTLDELDAFHRIGTIKEYSHVINA